MRPVCLGQIGVEQGRLLNLALNRISGHWDEEPLAHLLADLRPLEEIGLSLSGFTEDELSKLLKTLDLREKRERHESFDLEAA